jgi:glycosyltransferase involved in cell wall biosynthesis
MRILMLTEFYPPLAGGIEHQVRNLSRELVARGHDVAVTTLWHEGLAEYELDRGVRVYRVHSTMERTRGLFGNPGRTYAPPTPDPEAMWGIRRVIGRERPDVVHGHNWLVRSFLPLKAWSSAKLVMSLHMYGLVCAKQSLIYRGAPCAGPALTKCLTCAAEQYGSAKGVPIVVGNWSVGHAERAAVDMFLPVSQAVAAGSGLEGSGLPFRVIPPFLPDDISTPEGDAEPLLAQLPGEPYILFVGALGRYKGEDVLLRAYSRLKNAPPLVLIGTVWPNSPTEFPPGITVLKNWPHHAVMQAWRRSLFAVVPSVWPDAHPTVVLEAMATGRPVIGSRIGGIPEMIIDGQTGLLVSPGDPGALRCAIERLLADAALRSRMGRAGKERVRHYRAGAVVPRIEQVYTEITKPPGRCAGADDARTAEARSRGRVVRDPPALGEARR